MIDWNSLYSDRMNAIGHSEVIGILKLAERPDVISFAGGLPDSDTFLIEEVKEAVHQVLTQKGKAALGYGPTAGITPMREWLADHMTNLGRPSEMEECLVTTGGIAAFDLICKVLLNPGDFAVVCEPDYLAALHVIRSYQAGFIGIPADKEGMKSDVLLSRLIELRKESIRPKFIYLIPAFQNPSGISMSPARMRQIISIAGDFDVPIIEDGAYCELGFSQESPPLMASLDPKRVLHINTFSKIFNPGVRLGWVTGARELIETLILAKQGQDQCSSTLGQHLALTFAEKGMIERQKNLAVKTYGRKRDLMMSALDEYFPKLASWTRPDGGFYTWLTFGEGMDSEAVLPKAIEEARVAYVAGPAFFHNRKGQENLRLCYSYVPETQIREGIERLGLFFQENCI